MQPKSMLSNTHNNEVCFPQLRFITLLLNWWTSWRLSHMLLARGAFTLNHLPLIPALTSFVGQTWNLSIISCFDSSWSFKILKSCVWFHFFTISFHLIVCSDSSIINHDISTPHRPPSVQSAVFMGTPVFISRRDAFTVPPQTHTRCMEDAGAAAEPCTLTGSSPCRSPLRLCLRLSSRLLASPQQNHCSRCCCFVFCCFVFFILF